MKRFNQLMSLLLFAAVTQYSCINDADVALSDEIHSDSNGNLALFFEVPNETTNLSRSSESSDLTEEGSPQEYKVSSLTVYLFDAATKTLKDQKELQNISAAKKGTQNRILYTADKITVEPGTYNIFAIANGKAIPSDISTQDKFLNAVDETTYSEGKIKKAPEHGFVMTNRGNANLGIEVTSTNSDNVTNVSIGLERAVAKIELAQTKDKFELQHDGETYCTITISNFNILNLASRFYTFRHTAVLNEFKEPSSYTDENFGKVNDENGYVIDPYFFKKTVEDAKDFTNADGFYVQALVDPDLNNHWEPMGNSFIYCLENCTVMHS